MAAVTLSVLAHLGGTQLLARGPSPTGAAARERAAPVVMALTPPPAPPPPAAPPPPPPPAEPKPVAPPRPRAVPVPRAAAAPPPVSPDVTPPAPPADVPATNSPGPGSGIGLGGPGAGPGGGAGPGAGGGGPPAPPVRPAPPARVAAPAPVAARELGERPRPPALAGELARRYPPDARRLGVPGEAAVRALVGPSGRVERADLERESRTGFGAACRAALLASRWSPPRDKQGRAVATWIRYTCRFEVSR